VALKDAKYIYIIPTLILIFMSHYLRAVRWSALIAPIKKVSVLNLFSATMIGFMANSVLPARIGEIIRPVMVAKKEKVKVTASFATVVMERIFDMLCVIVFASLLFFFLPAETLQDKSVSVINHVEASTEAVKAEYANEESEAEASNTIKQLKKWSIVNGILWDTCNNVTFLIIIIPQEGGCSF
jgi:uncharacterized protein (TIRG00374 family)